MVHPEAIRMTKVYGADWCGDCRRAKQALADLQEPFEWIDVSQDSAARAHVERVVGKLKIPLIEFADGSSMVEPSNAALTEKVQALRV